MSVRKTLLAVGIALGVTAAGFCDAPSPVVVHSGYICGKTFIAGLTIHADDTRVKTNDPAQAKADCTAAGKLCIVSDICALAAAYGKAHGADQSQEDSERKSAPGEQNL